ncbi:Sensor histidine kinase DesK [Corynebacterium atrinae]|uniref:sensor histidine kinase n=1 Tax=Corynebacterium atrinae TaxID=1336740 RepID=UPI0025B29C69|nr:histidine kinase [Corynebacterium atrinae]WJY63710.1 Sensor histidine kinase DesK [Corynebacterium atrinae]
MTKTHDVAVPRPAGQLSDATRTRGSVATGLRASWWYSWSGLAMVILASNSLVVVPAAMSTPGLSARAILTAVVCVVSAGTQLAFLMGLRQGMGRGVDNWPVAVAMLLAGAGVLGIAAPLPWSSLPLISAAALLACAVKGGWRWLVLAVAAGAILIEVMAMPEGSHRGSSAYFFAVVFPLTTIGTVWAWDVVVRIDDARASESRLAVARERLRFASDLHDIQGHTLQVIALKAELAERLLDKDPAAARAQLAEIRTLAADSLSETRELVQGYRAPELSEELSNAHDVLEAAGFPTRLDAPRLPHHPGSRAVFGRVLREATTNILRHAAPGPVELLIDDRGTPGWSLRISNAVGASISLPTEGSGLAGLRERLGAAGGSLSTTVDAERFTLEATLPPELEVSE